MSNFKMMNQTELTQWIKACGAELGFDLVGIVHPQSLTAGEESVETWVSEGRHGTMRYLEQFRERRERLEREVGGIRSVIVLGVNYYSSVERPAFSDQEKDACNAGVSKRYPLDAPPAVLQGRVARYAWGRDYHEVIGQKHAQMIARMKQELGAEFRAKSCVDTQALPERYAAVRAGFGFTGKHTNLLSKQYGPWLFLSEIVTNRELAEDQPAQGTCGTCVHCQKVCPTGALDEDYRMDARRCIAYLTIEYKGIIPREMRPQIKDWLFGCDECLAICPFTAHSQETKWPELRAEAGAGAALNVTELFSLKTNSAYEKRFQGTALLRAGRKQMLRNACLVLGNSGDERAVPYLSAALEDPAPLVRLHAAWALGRFTSQDARAALERHLALEQDPEARQEILEALRNKRGNGLKPFPTTELPQVDKDRGVS